MKSINLILLSLLSLIVGALYLALSQGWILFHYPSYKTQTEQTSANLRAEKKQVKLIFWHQNKWQSESVEILVTQDPAQTLQHLVNNWLSLLDEEQLMKKKVTLQSALIRSDNRTSSIDEAYLSFDRNPFDEKSSTHEKWMWIESLLKTIRENGIALQSVRFLVHHQIMQDNHLDFSNPWALAGFLKG
ncbi:hypothetical protein ACFLX2_00970 [Candidatus Dependentiae bacterium]